MNDLFICSYINFDTQISKKCSQLKSLDKGDAWLIKGGIIKGMADISLKPGQQ